MSKILTAGADRVSCPDYFASVKLFSFKLWTVSAGLCLFGLWVHAQTGNSEPVGPKPVVNDDGFQIVGFDQLASFEFTPPNYDATGSDGKPVAKKSDAKIPERIKALDAKKVVVTGFMLPIKMNEGLVTEFLLVKDPMMCCYGIMPKINEWVIVRMTGKGVPPLMDVPIGFEGKLKVGELYDNGYLTGIYLLEGEKQTKEKG